MAITTAVKIIDSQRWICRIQMFQFNGTSSEESRADRMTRSPRSQLPSAPYQRASWVIWTRLPQVSFSWAMVEPVTSVGGMVNSAPRALMRS